MEVRISKRCFECGYIELVKSADRPLIIALDLTISDDTNDNLVCMRCRAEAIRLDIDVSDTLAPYKKDRPWQRQ